MRIPRPRRIAALLALLTCVGAGNAFAAVSSLDEELVRLKLDHIEDIKFTDEYRKPITREEFDKRRSVGFQVKQSTSFFGSPRVVLNLVSPPPVYKVKAGEAFPPFQFEQLGGGALDNKALMGRPTVLNFYFAACAPCVKEVPLLNALASARADLNFVAVTFDSTETAQKFSDTTKLSWKVVPNAKKFLKDLGVIGYPAFAIIDAQGNLVALNRVDQISKSDKTIAAWVARLAPAAQ